MLGYFHKTSAVYENCVGGIGGSTGWLSERLRGIVKEYLAAPIPRLSILLGNAMSVVTKSLLQAFVIFMRVPGRKL